MRILALTLLLSSAASAASDDPPRGLMAVLELRNRLPPGDNVDRGYFSDRVRQAALRALPELNLMTRENMDVIAHAIGVDLAECEGECEVVTGRKLGAETVVSGELTRVGTIYKLTLRLHATREGRLLSVGQAGGRTLEDMDRDLDQAGSELFAPLIGGARRFPAAAATALRPGQRRPVWPWIWTRDHFQVSGGWAGSPGMGNGPSAIIRLFGLEARYISYSNGDNLAEVGPGGTNVCSGPCNSRFKGFAAGLSPISLGTDRSGPQDFAFTYLEPYALVRFGTVQTVSNGVPINDGYTNVALMLGNRFAFAIGLSSGVALRLGLDVGVDQIVQTKVMYNNGSTHVAGAVWAGVGYGNP